MTGEEDKELTSTTNNDPSPEAVPIESRRKKRKTDQPRVPSNPVSVAYRSQYMNPLRIDVEMSQQLSSEVDRRRTKKAPVPLEKLPAGASK